ncbi:tubulin polyglutamylase ttll6-like [Engraulis encrasicolus]|uniref:tubulin polyglutamylase ttll6-like n=1 Tax=Engraulis encrasicolus TaxID=184585 RepID=UPI002FCE9176
MFHKISKTDFAINHVCGTDRNCHREIGDCNPERILAENKKRKKLRGHGINLLNCKYECVRKAALAVGLREVDETEEWMVFWTDCSVSMDRIMDMKRYQRINHFPGMIEICRKDLLARNMNRMRRYFPKDYNIFPKTWCLPTEYIEFQGYCRSLKQKTIICKPESGCQGKGIFITRHPQNISPDEHIICQAYISKPFIIEDYKFDLRLYVLVTSCDPLRVFLFKEGLVRFATSKYRSPNNSNVSDVCMHLTNYAVNKNSENYDHDVQKGSKRKLSWLRVWLERHSYDAGATWRSIEDVIVKTLLVAAPVLRQNYRTAFPGHVGPSSCFELLGFDILLDFKLKPWLLEVNHSPSFHTESALDEEVKEALLKDTLTLLNLTSSDRRRIVEEDKRLSQERLLQKKHSSSQRELLQSSQASRLAEVEEHEERHSGGFYRIYPRDNEHLYSRFLQQAKKYCQETLASRAREEYNRQVVQSQQDKEPAAQGRSLGRGRGHQGESSGEQRDRCDERRDQRQLRRQPSTSSSFSTRDWSYPAGRTAPSSGRSWVWNSFEARHIVEEEEVVRQRLLSQREALVRRLGVEHAVHALLGPTMHLYVPNSISAPRWPPLATSGPSGPSGTYDAPAPHAPQNGSHPPGHADALDPRPPFPIPHGPHTPSCLHVSCYRFHVSVPRSAAVPHASLYSRAQCALLPAPGARSAHPAASVAQSAASVAPAPPASSAPAAPKCSITYPAGITARPSHPGTHAGTHTIQPSTHTETHTTHSNTLSATHTTHRTSHADNTHTCRHTTHTCLPSHTTHTCLPSHSTLHSAHTDIHTAQSSAHTAIDYRLRGDTSTHRGTHCCHPAHTHTPLPSHTRSAGTTHTQMPLPSHTHLPSARTSTHTPSPSTLERYSTATQGARPVTHTPRSKATHGVRPVACADTHTSLPQLGPAKKGGVASSDQGRAAANGCLTVSRVPGGMSGGVIGGVSSSSSQVSVSLIELKLPERQQPALPIISGLSVWKQLCRNSLRPLVGRDSAQARPIKRTTGEPPATRKEHAQGSEHKPSRSE